MHTKLVKTEVVDRERKFSRTQPEINFRIASGFGVGINMTKLNNFVGNKFGIKIKLN